MAGDLTVSTNSTQLSRSENKELVEENNPKQEFSSSPLSFEESSDRVENKLSIDFTVINTI
jgi:hypothetical protein